MTKLSKAGYSLSVSSYHITWQA